MPSLSVPTSILPGTIFTVDGAGFDPAKPRVQLAIDGVGTSVNEFRVRPDGSFRVGMLAPAAGSHTVTARNYGGSTVASAPLNVASDPVPTPRPPQEPLAALPVPATPALPAAGVPTKIGDRTYTRIGYTGQRHAYATLQPWSKDGKRLYLYYDGGWLLDGVTLDGKQIGAKDRAQWSRTDPDVLYHQSGSKIVAYNAVSGATATVHDFGRTISIGNGEGAISDTGVLPIMDGAANVCTLDTLTGNATPWFALPRRPDNLKISHDGVTLVAVYESGSRETWAYPLTGGTGRKLRPYGNHCDTVAGTDGRQYLVTCSPSVDRIDLETGATVRLLDSPNAYETGHVSGRGPAGTACLSTYGNPARPGGHQVVSVDIATAKLVRRYGFDFGKGTAEPYEACPMAVLSPDGTKALFASSWGGSSWYPFMAEA